MEKLKAKGLDLGEEVAREAIHGAVLRVEGVDLANAVRFAKLDFDIASRSFLLKAAARLLHGTIRESIEKAAVLPIGRFLPSLSKLDIPVTDGHVQGNFATAPAWPAHPKWLAGFLGLLGTKITL